MYHLRHADPPKAGTHHGKAGKKLNAPMRNQTLRAPRQCGAMASDDRACPLYPPCFSALEDLARLAPGAAGFSSARAVIRVTRATLARRLSLLWSSGRYQSGSASRPVSPSETSPVQFDGAFSPHRPSAVAINNKSGKPLASPWMRWRHIRGPVIR